MARLGALLLLALAACAGREEAREVSCVEGRPAADVAASLPSRLTAEGWRDIVIEPRAGRWIVRAVRDGGLGIAGKVEDGADGCAGARVALTTHVIPAGAARKTAGPTGLARPARLPVSP